MPKCQLGMQKIVQGYRVESVCEQTLFGRLRVRSLGLCIVNCVTVWVICVTVVVLTPALWPGT